MYISFICFFVVYTRVYPPHGSGAHQSTLFNAVVYCASSQTDTVPAARSLRVEMKPPNPAFLHRCFLCFQVLPRCVNVRDRAPLIYSDTIGAGTVARIDAVAWEREAPVARNLSASREA